MERIPVLLNVGNGKNIHVAEVLVFGGQTEFGLEPGAQMVIKFETYGYVEALKTEWYMLEYKNPDFQEYEAKYQVIVGHDEILMFETDFPVVDENYKLVQEIIVQPKQ